VTVDLFQLIDEFVQDVLVAGAARNEDVDGEYV